MSVAVSALTLESIWFDKYKFGDAEQQYYERLQKLQWIESCSEAVESPPPPPPTSTPKSKAPANKPIKEDQEAKVAKHQDKKMAKEEKENVVKEEKDSSAQEKTDIEKEAEVKKPSKKSKKNKKKNQQLLEGKSEPQVSTPKGTGEGKKGKGDAHAKEFSQDDNKKSSEPKKSEKKDGKKDNRCCSAGKSLLLDEIARARQQIKNSLNTDGLTGTVGMDILTRLQKLEEENSHLKNVFQELKTLNASLVCLSSRVEKLEKVCTNCTPKSASTEVKSTPTAPVTQSSAPIEKNDEDDVDLFGSDEEDDPEKEKIKAERLKMYEEKKSKKPTVVAKSNIILDVKPWDDETDMKAMETKVREVACDGLLWGASKLVPLAYGIHKLQISCVIEDDLVSVDWLQEQIEANEDLVQSVDIAAFNKV